MINCKMCREETAHSDVSLLRYTCLIWIVNAEFGRNNWYDFFRVVFEKRKQTKKQYVNGQQCVYVCVCLEKNYRVRLSVKQKIKKRSDCSITAQRSWKLAPAVNVRIPSVLHNITRRLMVRVEWGWSKRKKRINKTADRRGHRPIVSRWEKR